MRPVPQVAVRILHPASGVARARLGRARFVFATSLPSCGGVLRAFVSLIARPSVFQGRVGFGSSRNQDGTNELLTRALLRRRLSAVGH